MSRIAVCLGGQMRSFAAKCDLPPHTDAASTTDVASTRFGLPPRIAKYICSALAVLYHTHFAVLFITWVPSLDHINHVILQFQFINI
ncbi:hypothetical protein DPMN_193350 [Dreissena polymorpha]|uniref:Uncharacterized protein n=1 Tax=Dreissena polymorpha TaxID=45954 RepID=A0A9D4BFN1_DREPO|nr:hypothetical protein DPMN_193350 [Dreissena polymorpha]